MITQPEVVAKILEHLGLESVAPMTTTARPPPQMEFGFENYWRDSGWRARGTLG